MINYSVIRDVYGQIAIDLTEFWICLGSTRSRFSPMTALSVRGSASLSLSTPMYPSPLEIRKLTIVDGDLECRAC